MIVLNKLHFDEKNDKFQFPKMTFPISTRSSQRRQLCIQNQIEPVLAMYVQRDVVLNLADDANLHSELFTPFQLLIPSQIRRLSTQKLESQNIQNILSLNFRNRLLLKKWFLLERLASALCAKFKANSQSLPMGSRLIMLMI